MGAAAFRHGGHVVKTMAAKENGSLFSIKGGTKSVPIFLELSTFFAG